MQVLDPAAGDIAIIPGRVYEGDALIKDSHQEGDLRARLASYGVTLEEANRRDSGRRGYSFWAFRAVAGPEAGGMLPWGLPKPLSWIDETHVIAMRVRDGSVGAGRAETFVGVPEGFVIERVTSYLRDLPSRMTPRPGAGASLAWDGGDGEVVVQSRESGRMAVAVGDGAHNGRRTRLPRVKRHMLGAGDASTALLSSPQAQAAWADVKKQLVSEGASDFAIAAVQGTFGQALTQLASQGVQSGLGDAEILNAAKQYVLVGSTVAGAVQNVAGLIKNAGSTPPTALLTSFTGTLVGAAVTLSAGVFTAGLGAAIVGGLSTLLGLLQGAGFFGTPPQGTEVCHGFYCQGAVFTVVTQGPSGPIGCCCISQAQDQPAILQPGSSAWRNFPNVNDPVDRVWFLPSRSGAIGLWRGAVYGTPGQPAPNLPAERPIDQAFPQYRTLECNLAQAGGTLRDFMGAFMTAWQLNAAYTLNGLKAQDDAQVLLHTLRMWNKAHVPTNSKLTIAPAVGELVGPHDSCRPGVDDTKVLYPALLATAVAALASGDASIVDGQGNLVIAASPMRPSSTLLRGGLPGSLTQLVGASPGTPAAAVVMTAAATTSLAALGVAGAAGVAMAQGLPWHAHLLAGWDRVRGASSAIAGSVTGTGAGEARGARERRRRRRMVR